VSRRHPVSKRVLDCYLYPIGGWGLALVGLYFADRAALALALCFPLALWMGAVTAVWAVRTSQRLERGEVDRDLLAKSVLSIGHLMAGAAVTPGIVFLAADPLAPGSWGTTAGVVLVSAVAYHGTTLLTRASNRYAYAVALALAWVALPLNATGSVSVAGWLGWFDRLV